MPALGTSDRKVLIVHESRDALSAMSNLLEKQNAWVKTAQNGWEALNRLKVDRQISLVVLMSLSMPVMDGWEFLRRKRSDPLIAGIPVIVISTSSPGPLEGVTEVLTNPDPIDAFVDAVRRHVVNKGADT
jgi:CheY-like chemotaxis protein